MKIIHLIRQWYAWQDSNQLLAGIFAIALLNVVPVFAAPTSKVLLNLGTTKVLVLTGSVFTHIRSPRNTSSMDGFHWEPIAATVPVAMYRNTSYTVTKPLLGSSLIACHLGDRNAVHYAYLVDEATKTFVAKTMFPASWTAVQMQEFINEVVQTIDLSVHRPTKREFRAEKLYQEFVISTHHNGIAVRIIIAQHGDSCPIIKTIFPEIVERIALTSADTETALQLHAKGITEAATKTVMPATAVTDVSISAKKQSLLQATVVSVTPATTLLAVVTTQQPPLHVAAAAADYQRIFALLAEGHDPEEYNSEGYIPLYLLLQKIGTQKPTVDSDTAIISLATEAAPAIPCRGESALQLAVKNKQQDILEFLLASAAGNGAQEAAETAIITGNSQALSLLGNYIDVHGTQNNKPLLQLAVEKQPSMVRLLLQQFAADMYVPVMQNKKEVPLLHAYKKDSKQQALLQECWQELTAAAKEADESLLSYVVRQDLSHTTRALLLSLDSSRALPERATALRTAIDTARPAMVALLLGETVAERERFASLALLVDWHGRRAEPLLAVVARQLKERQHEPLFVASMHKIQKLLKDAADITKTSRDLLTAGTAKPADIMQLPDDFILFALQDTKKAIFLQAVKAGNSALVQHLFHIAGEYIDVSLQNADQQDAMEIALALPNKTTGREIITLLCKTAKGELLQRWYQLLADHCFQELAVSEQTAATVDAIVAQYNALVTEPNKINTLIIQQAIEKNHAIAPLVIEQASRTYIVQYGETLLCSAIAADNKDATHHILLRHPRLLTKKALQLLGAQAEKVVDTILATYNNDLSLLTSVQEADPRIAAHVRNEKMRAEEHRLMQQGLSPLVIAIQRGDSLAAVEQMIEQQPQLLIGKGTGTNDPVVIALMQRKDDGEKVAAMLLKHYAASPPEKNKYLATLLAIALERQLPVAAIEFIIRQGAPLPLDRVTAEKLVACAANNDNKELQQFIQTEVQKLVTTVAMTQQERQFAAIPFCYKPLDVLLVAQLHSGETTKFALQQIHGDKVRCQQLLHNVMQKQQDCASFCDEVVLLFGSVHDVSLHASLFHLLLQSIIADTNPESRERRLQAVNQLLPILKTKDASYIQRLCEMRSHDNDGETLLHGAVQAQCYALATFVREHVSLSALQGLMQRSNKRGQSVLHLLLQSADDEWVDFLLHDTVASVIPKELPKCTQPTTHLAIISKVYHQSAIAFLLANRSTDTELLSLAMALDCGEAPKNFSVAVAALQACAIPALWQQFTLLATCLHEKKPEFMQQLHDCWLAQANNVPLLHAYSGYCSVVRGTQPVFTATASDTIKFLLQRLQEVPPCEPFDLFVANAIVQLLSIDPVNAERYYQEFATIVSSQRFWRCYDQKQRVTMAHLLAGNDLQQQIAIFSLLQAGAVSSIQQTDWHAVLSRDMNFLRNELVLPAGTASYFMFANAALDQRSNEHVACLDSQLRANLIQLTALLMYKRAVLFLANKNNPQEEAQTLCSSLCSCLCVEFSQLLQNPRYHAAIIAALRWDERLVLCTALRCMIAESDSSYFSSILQTITAFHRQLLVAITVEAPEQLTEQQQDERFAAVTKLVLQGLADSDYGQNYIIGAMHHYNNPSYDGCAAADSSTPSALQDWQAVNVVRRDVVTMTYEKFVRYCKDRPLALGDSGMGAALEVLSHDVLLDLFTCPFTPEQDTSFDACFMQFLFEIKCYEKSMASSYAACKMMGYMADSKLRYPFMQKCRQLLMRAVQHNDAALLLLFLEQTEDLQQSSEWWGKLVTDVRALLSDTDVAVLKNFVAVHCKGALPRWLE
ncbi:ankyrin repeat domain-containing protein [Candidatus Dependentiae bacterium]|nr:ankyrin repeat domain-containing protein [Candidatus Dependentiae bacterium]